MSNRQAELPAIGFMLPANLDLEAILPTHRKRSMHLYACFCHMLYEAALFQKKKDTDGFIRLDSRKIRRLLTTKEATQVRADLGAWGIIECDGSYTISTPTTPGKCMGYRFTAMFRDAVPKTYLLQNKPLLKKFNTIYQERALKIAKLKSSSATADFLFRQMQNLYVDWEEAFNHAIKQHPKAIAMGWQQFKKAFKRMKVTDFVYKPIPNSPLPVTFPILEFSNSVYNKFYNVHRFTLAIDGIVEAITFKRCEKTGRLYTNLNNLAKEYRPFIHHRSGQHLCLIDIGECQPFLFACHMKAIAGSIWGKQLPDDVTLYIEKTSKREFYDFMLQTHGNSTHDRSDFKQLLFSSVFYLETTLTEKPSNSIAKTFRDTFPNVYKELRALKERVGVRRLSHHMMKLESEIMIDTVCRKIASLKDDSFFVATIHDALITTADKVPIVISLIEDAFSAKFGITPTIMSEDFNHDDLPF